MLPRGYGILTGWLHGGKGIAEEPAREGLDQCARPLKPKAEPLCVDEAFIPSPPRRQRGDPPVQAQRLGIARIVRAQRGFARTQQQIAWAMAVKFKADYERLARYRVEIDPPAHIQDQGPEVEIFHRGIPR